jgi:acyl-CoA thioester hydrolase
LRVRKVEFEVTAYTFQIDFAGHVNNSVYLQWMEIGRTKLLEAAGMTIPAMMEAGVVPVLASTEISYKRPLNLGDRVRVQVWLSAITGASARIEVRFLDTEGVLVASGSHRGVFVDTRRGRPLRITAKMKEGFHPFLQETGEESGDRNPMGR